MSVENVIYTLFKVNKYLEQLRKSFGIFEEWYGRILTVRIKGNEPELLTISLNKDSK